MRTIVGLAIVIAVIWGLAWILRQVKSGRDPRVSAAGLTSVAALTLGSGRSVHLVKAGNDYILLGAAEQGLAPIHRYTEQQAYEADCCSTKSPKRAPADAALPASPVAAAPARGHLGTRHIGTISPTRPPLPASRPRSNPANAGRPDADAFGSSSLVERLRELTVRR